MHSCVRRSRSAAAGSPSAALRCSALRRRRRWPASRIGCLLLQRLCAFELAWPRLAMRPLREAGLAWSLLVVEEPALALTLLVAALPTLVRVLRAYALPLPNLLVPLFFWPLLAFGAMRAGAAPAALYPSPGGLAAFGDSVRAAVAPAARAPSEPGPGELGPSLLMGLGLAGALLRVDGWRAATHRGAVVGSLARAPRRERMAREERRARWVHAVRRCGPRGARVRSAARVRDARLARYRRRAQRLRAGGRAVRDGGTRLSRARRRCRRRARRRGASQSPGARGLAALTRAREGLVRWRARRARAPTC